MRSRPPPPLRALLAAALTLSWGCTLLNWGDYRAGGFGGAGTTSTASGMGGDIVLSARWPDSATASCSDGNMTVPCPTPPGADYHGQDGDYTIYVPTYQLISAGNDVALTDAVTGLVWEADFAAIAATPVDWALANMHCDALRNNNYAGMPGWRLPSRRELAALIDAGHDASLFPKEFDPLLMDAMQNTTIYWTRTNVAGNANNAWIYRFVPVPTQGVDDILKTFMVSGRAMCVAGPLTYTAPLLTPDNEVVRDTSTGLTWQRVIPAMMMNWVDSLKYCQTLIANGAGGFRLPSIKELLSIVDDTRANPVLDATIFPGVATATFWTSSPSPSAPQSVWTVDLTDGTAIPEHQPGILYKTLCVR